MTRVLRNKESPLKSFENKPLDPGTLDPLNPLNQRIGRRSKNIYPAGVSFLENRKQAVPEAS